MTDFLELQTGWNKLIIETLHEWEQLGRSKLSLACFTCGKFPSQFAAVLEIGQKYEDNIRFEGTDA
jgi:hypothetical protein